MGNNRAFEILEDLTYEYMSKIRVVEAMKQYAKECVKASLEKASENARVMTKNIDTENELEVLSWTDSRNVKFSVSKQSISNEDNIVLV